MNNKEFLKKKIEELELNNKSIKEENDLLNTLNYLRIEKKELNK